MGQKGWSTPSTGFVGKVGFQTGLMGASVFVFWIGSLPIRQPVTFGVEAAKLLMDLVLPHHDHRPPLGEGEGLGVVATTTVPGYAALMLLVSVAAAASGRLDPESRMDAPSDSSSGMPSGIQ